MNAMAKTILVLLIALTAVAAAQSAGFIGEVRFKSNDYPPIDPNAYDEAIAVEWQIDKSVVGHGAYTVRYSAALSRTIC